MKLSYYHLLKTKWNINNINENIERYESKLFKIYEDLVDKEEFKNYKNFIDKEELLSLNNDDIINYHELNNLVIHPDIENYIRSKNNNI